MSEPKVPITLEVEIPPLERLARRFQTPAETPEAPRFTRDDLVKAFLAGVGDESGPHSDERIFLKLRIRGIPC